MAVNFLRYGQSLTANLKKLMLPFGNAMTNFVGGRLVIFGHTVTMHPPPIGCHCRNRRKETNDV